MIGALQKREYSLAGRMRIIGGMTRLLNEAFLNRENWIISGAIEVCSEMGPGDDPKRDDEFIVLTLYRLMRMFSRNASVEEQIAQNMTHLGFSLDEELEGVQIASAAELFRTDLERFDRQFPEWPRFFEQIMVNHMFFDRFPFSDRHESLWEDYISLCAGYAFVRFMAVVGMAEKEGLEALIDILSAVFRVIEHSSFDLNAAALLEAKGVSSLEDMARLTMI